MRNDKKKFTMKQEYAENTPTCACGSADLSQEELASSLDYDGKRIEWRKCRCNKCGKVITRKTEAVTV